MRSHGKQTLLWLVGLLATVHVSVHAVAVHDGNSPRAGYVEGANHRKELVRNEMTSAKKASARKPTVDDIKADMNLRNAMERMKARNGYLSNTNTDVSEWHLGGAPAFHNLALSEGAVVSLLAPVYQCPWTLSRTNYVSEYNFDGGKWTCGVQEMAVQRTTGPRCVVYSFGSNKDDFFEKGLMKIDPSCEVHIFDPTSGAPPASWDGKYKFHSSGLCVGDSTTSFTFDGKSYPCKSLRMHMKDLGHAYVDILKMDIEGTELEWMRQQEYKSIEIGQILMEWHLGALPPERKTFKDFLQGYVVPLEQAGFLSTSIEPVAGRPNLLQYEVAFLNRRWSPKGFSNDPDGSLSVFSYPVTPGVSM